ncbi:hypothetical protein KIL84_000393, partial [Mauremys mutica]
DTIRKAAADLELALTDVKLVQENEQVSTVKSVDINGYMLCEELEALKPIISSDCRNPLKILQFLAYNNRSTGFPNLFIAIRIFLTIPVTVASGERNFSKLNLIKTYLRSTMQEDRLNNLAIMSIEWEVMKRPLGPPVGLEGGGQWEDIPGVVRSWDRDNCCQALGGAASPDAEGLCDLGEGPRHEAPHPATGSDPCAETGGVGLAGSWGSPRYQV